MPTLYLTISSITENLFEGEAVLATVPSSTGELTILPNHEPLVTTLEKGTITVKIKGAESKQFHIENGVLEVSGTRAVILV